MKRQVGITAVMLVLLVVGIVMVPVLWTGHAPQTGAPILSSILPTPGPASATPPPTATPPRHPTPGPAVFPPPTVVYPTPPTPDLNAPLISEAQAIAIAMGPTSVWREMQQRGEITITTKLTVHGDHQAYTTHSTFSHPALRVWMVYIHHPPQPHGGSPIGIPLPPRARTINLHAYEIDAVTGEEIGMITTNDQ